MVVHYRLLTITSGFWFLTYSWFSVTEASFWLNFLYRISNSNFIHLKFFNEIFLSHNSRNQLP